MALVSVFDFSAFNPPPTFLHLCQGELESQSVGSGRPCLCQIFPPILKVSVPQTGPADAGPPYPTFCVGTFLRPPTVSA